MNPYFQDSFEAIYCGDCRSMVEVADGGVQCVVTSPPYWGLRKYEGSQELIWGDNHCEHQWGEAIPNPMNKSGKHGPASILTKTADEQHAVRKESNQGSFCQLCGAWKGAFGLEPTPELYVQHTIEILREIRRVLRKDGVCFLNLGDSYAGSWGSMSHDLKGKAKRTGTNERPPTSFVGGKRGEQSGKRGKALSDLKVGDESSGNPYDECVDCQRNRSLGNGSCPVQAPEPSSELSNHSHKERLTDHLDNSDLASQGGHSEGETSGLCSSPELVDGEVPGALGSTCPASSGKSSQSQFVPTCSYYQSFQHSASQSNYTTFNLKPKDLCLIPFHIAIAAQEDGWWIRSVIIWNKPNPMPESVTDRPTNSHEFILMLTKSKKYYWDADAVREKGFYPAGEIRRAGEDHKEFMSDSRTTHGLHAKDWIGDGGRNLRDVWEFPTQSYSKAHFAVFPEKLPELCIKAATSEKGCCPKCGAPWVRVLDKKSSQFNIRVRDARAGRATAEEGYKATKEEIARYPGNHPDMGYRQTVGWRPTCDCGLEPVPCTALDPFMGTGMTLWVAKKMGRRAIGYDISEAYCKLAVERNRQMALELK